RRTRRGLGVAFSPAVSDWRWPFGRRVVSLPSGVWLRHPPFPGRCVALAIVGERPPWPVPPRGAFALGGVWLPLALVSRLRGGLFLWHLPGLFCGPSLRTWLWPGVPFRRGSGGGAVRRGCERVV